MSKKLKATSVDFDVGVDVVIPSTQEAFREGEYDGEVRRVEKKDLISFREMFGSYLDRRSAGDTQFPSNSEVFVVIIQYFVAEKEYARRDIDNMAKTVLDVLKGRFYRDDSQVRTLLIGKKKIDHRVTQNFAYVAIKELNDGQEVDALKISGAERAVTLFQESQAKLRRAS